VISSEVVQSSNEDRREVARRNYKVLVHREPVIWRKTWIKTRVAGPVVRGDVVVRRKLLAILIRGLHDTMESQDVRFSLCSKGVFMPQSPTFSKYSNHYVKPLNMKVFGLII
jgi:hypothetical protein